MTSPWRDGWRLAVGTLTVLPVRPPERVDAAALQAVASQDIHRLEGPGWADAVVGG